MADKEIYISCQDAAKLAGKHVSRIYQMAKKGQIQATTARKRPGRKGAQSVTYVNLGDLQRVISATTAQPVKTITTRPHKASKRPQRAIGSNTLTRVANMEKMISNLSELIKLATPSAPHATI